MRRAGCLLLLLSALLPACASRRDAPLPVEPPADFRICVTVGGLEEWPWEGWVAIAAGGAADYEVRFTRGEPGSRRGAETVDDAAVRTMWDAAREAGLFAEEPGPAGRGAGPVTVEGRALGLSGRIDGDPARSPALRGILAALRVAAPGRVFRPVPAPEKRK